MASGDASRVWFAEMVSILREQWSSSPQWEEWVRLRDRLDTELHTIRSTRGIRSPIILCPSCGKRARAAEPSVSVRAMILALERFGIVEKNEAKALEKKWELVRRTNKLDLHGKPMVDKEQVHMCD